MKKNIAEILLLVEETLIAPHQSKGNRKPVLLEQVFILQVLQVNSFKGKYS